MLLDINELNPKDYNDVVEYSQDESTIALRYIAACSIIANLANDLDPDLLPDDENVDLSICKMLMDGAIEIESLSRTTH